METKTLHLRLKSKNTKYLARWASEVNFVWNFVNELTVKAWKRDRKWLSGFDVQKYTTGVTKCGLSIGSATVQEISEQHAIRRKQFKRSKLRWRNSKRTGWIPFKSRQLKYRDGQLKFNGKLFRVWDTYGLDQYELHAGSFSQDTRGNWYVSISVKFEPEKSNGTKQLGIDLGLKDIATYSDGSRFSDKHWYRKLESKLASAQRANKKHLVRTISNKIKNSRKDAIHKETTQLVKSCKQIVVGNVNSLKLAKTNMAKSVMDAGWGMFRAQLAYKCRWAAVAFAVVNEAFSTKTCSTCGCLSGPTGRSGLSVRDWKCSDCGTSHDRDVNAALNILNLGLGHGPLYGIPGL